MTKFELVFDNLIGVSFFRKNGIECFNHGFEEVSMNFHGTSFHKNQSACPLDWRLEEEYVAFSLNSPRR